MRTLALAALLAVPVLAHAAPPAGVDPNGPAAKWVEKWLNAYQTLCCGIDSDCRPTAVVPSETGPTGWKAWISREKYGPTAPDGWVDVPQSAFDKSSEGNPTGVSWACWYAMQVRCVAIGSGT